LNEIEPRFRLEQPDPTASYDPRWIAFKLYEQDSDILSKVSSRQLFDDVSKSIAKLRTIFGDDPEIISRQAM
jgi:hypothetical protein